MDPDKKQKAVDAIAKLEVLKAALEVTKKKKEKPKVDAKDAKLQAYRAAAKEPLTEKTREAHLFNINETIKQLESQAKDVAGSNLPNKAELHVQLEFALEKAESTRGHLIQMEKKPEHQKKAQEGLDFLNSFHLEG